MFQGKITSLLCLLLSRAFVDAASIVERGSFHESGKFQQPTVRVRNGTIAGFHSNHYDQDIFLGIPYAKPPVGNLRFARPQPATAWTGMRDASKYGDWCIGYGFESLGQQMSEDCLTINIVKPTSIRGPLPVVAWIHGGGFRWGGSAWEAYNMSAMVENSVKISKPFIGVSFNYRLSLWGFISGRGLSATGNTNLGLRDQRQALHWIQENIAAFGGDARKVTIWGQSAGAQSVAAHLGGFGGRDDHLFRAAIMVSGGFNGGSLPNQAGYDRLANVTGCANSEDSLACLRKVPFDTLNNLYNTSSFGTFSGFGGGPYLDGDISKYSGTLQLQRGQFVKVPIITGSNTDEGAGSAPLTINTTDDFRAYLLRSIPSVVADKILELYPDDPCVGIPTTAGCNRLPSQGLQFRRVAAYVGDVAQVSQRRLACLNFANYGVPAYCYRFNVVPANEPTWKGSYHFRDVPFTFLDFQGLGNPSTDPNGGPFVGRPKSYYDVAYLMSSMWAGFIHDGDPNTGAKANGWGGDSWPHYKSGRPVDWVFDANVTSHYESDTFRKPAVDYLNSLAISVYNH